MAEEDAVSQPERLLQHFITVGIGDTINSFEGAKDQPPLDIFRPITSIIVCTGPNPPSNYELVKFTVGGESASLRQGYFGPQVWLATSRDPNHGDPITEIVVIKEEEKPTGFFKVDYNFQKLLRRGGDMFGRGGSPAYIFFERDPMKVPILEVIFINEAEKEIPPPDFWRVQNDGIQSGIRFGPGLDLYYKKCAATPLDQFYKPNVLDMYPKKGAYLPVTVAQFCQPSGAVLMRAAPLPVSHDFVLTNALGRRMYGSALTCFELLPGEVWAKSLDSILQKFPRMSVSSDAIIVESPVSGRTLPPRSVTAECQSPEHITRGLSLSFESKPIYASKTLCLLSYYPFFDQFRSMLAELYRISVSPRTYPLEHVLVNMFEIPVPLSSHVASQMRIGAKTVIFRIPSGDEDFPLLNCSFQLLFRSLSLNAILLVLNALILERKVIIVSSHARLLTPIAESLLALLFPLQWQYSYVPVLPRMCSGILDAPMPVFVGLRQSYVDPRLYERSDTVVVDLDSRKVYISGGESSLVPFPSNLTSILRSELEEYGKVSSLTPLSKEELDNLDLTFPMLPTEDQRRSQSALYDHFSERAVRASFVHFFAGLFGNFREFLLFPEIPNNIRLDELFEKKKFLEDKPKGPQRAFTAALFETQSFVRFIEERTFPSDRDSELKFFDRCCDYHRSVESLADKTESLAGLVQSLLTNSDIKFIYKVPPPPPFHPSQNLPPFPSFPVLDDSSLYDPRPVVVENFHRCSESPDDTESEFKQAFFQSKPTINALFLHRRSMERLASSFQSNIDWARHLLMLVYSSWFLLQSLSVDWDSSIDSSIVDSVFDVLKRAEKSDLHPDESTYRSVLKLCAKFSRADSARAILQQMKDTGIQPSQVTYALFTSAVTEAPISPHTRQAVEDFKKPSIAGTAASLLLDYLTISSKLGSADLIDWSHVLMSTVSICTGCNSKLSDCEIMSGWSDNPDIETSRCIVCQSVSFQPELNVRLVYTNQKKESLCFAYLSPLVLRTRLEKAVATDSKDTFSPRNFRTSYPILFYNLLWYFYHEKLSLEAIVGKETVVIKRIVPRHRRDSLLNDESETDSSSPPKNHHNSRNALIRYLERNDVLNAMRLFLLHRIKEANVGGSGILDKSSVWSHSMFREMDALGAQWFFPSRSDWIQSYCSALGNVPKHMQNYLLAVDNAPSSVTSIFEDVFRHGEASSHYEIARTRPPTKFNTSENCDAKADIST